MGNCASRKGKQREGSLETEAVDEEDKWLSSSLGGISNDLPLQDIFRVIPQVVGHGSTCLVWSGEDRQTGQKVAIKRCSKSNLKEIKLENVKFELWNCFTDSQTREVEVLSKIQNLAIRCPSIPRLLGAFEDGKRLFLVMPLCHGGDLYSWMSQRAENGSFSEVHASIIVRQLAETLHVLHSNKVVHSDVNPTNVVFKTRESPFLQLVDYGNSIILDSPVGNLISSKRENKEKLFSAPEALKVNFRSSDLWSLGAILAVMLGCVKPPPVLGGKKEKLEAEEEWKSLKAGKIQWLPSNVSPWVYDLLSRLLTPVVRNRFSAAQVLCHPWLKQRSFEESPLKEGLEKVQAFEEGRKLLRTQCKFVYLQKRAQMRGKKPTCCVGRVTNEVEKKLDDWKRKKKSSWKKPKKVDSEQEKLLEKKLAKAKVLVEFVEPLKPQKSGKLGVWGKKKSCVYDETTLEVKRTSEERSNRWNFKMTKKLKRIESSKFKIF